jgi:hypothetical protein
LVAKVGRGQAGGEAAPLPVCWRICALSTIADLEALHDAGVSRSVQASASAGDGGAPRSAALTRRGGGRSFRSEWGGLDNDAFVADLHRRAAAARGGAAPTPDPTPAAAAAARVAGGRADAGCRRGVGPADLEPGTRPSPGEPGGPPDRGPSGERLGSGPTGAEGLQGEWQPGSGPGPGPGPDRRVSVVVRLPAGYSAEDRYWAAWWGPDAGVPAGAAAAAVAPDAGPPGGSD